jgi:hypothetical protein
MDKNRCPDCISQRNPLSPTEGKVAQVKIMLTPSTIYKDEKWQKKNQVVKLKYILMCFYFSLEYRSSYYKEGCNMVILTKPKCSKSFSRCHLYLVRYIRPDRISSSGSRIVAVVLVGHIHHRLDISNLSDLSDLYRALEPLHPSMIGYI